MGEEVSNLSIEEKLQNTTERWTNYIRDLNDKMKDLGSLQNLMNMVYVKRQECVEYIGNLDVTFSKLKRAYTIQYAQKYNFYKFQSQLRYSSDAAINTQIQSDLIDITEKKDLIESHLDTMRETLKTINEIIRAVYQRIELYKLINNMKF